MAKNRRWWNLNIEGNTHEELSDVDREHITDQIRKGCIEGEIVEDDD